MLKDLPASLVAAVSQINQKSREAYVEEQKSIEVKKDIKAKHSSMMPKQPAPKADEAAVANARKMAEEANQIDEKLTDEAKKKIQTALGPKGSQNNMRKTSASARAIIGLAKTNPDNTVKKEEVEGTVPKTPREKELAAKHGNKKLITHGDVMKARGIHKEEIEQADEEHGSVKHLPAKTSPALAAWIGREKFGKKKFQAMAEKGKKQQAEEVEAVEEGLMDTMKKIGKKVVDTIGHKDDKDLLDDLRKKVNPAPAASAPAAKAKLKSPMAHDYVKEDFMKMENWNAMLKKVKDDSEEEKKSKGTGKFDVKKTTTGTEYTRKSSTFNNGTADKPSAKNEEVEELDELSKSTLGSYTKKASLNATITRKIAGDFENRANRAKSPGMKDANTELSSKYKQKSWKRRDGVEKAVDRLTKEEVEVIDEATAVHPKAIHVSDAGGGKYKVHAVGKDFSHGIKVGEHLNDTHLDDFSEMGGKVKMVKPPKKD